MLSAQLHMYNQAIFAAILFSREDSDGVGAISPDKRNVAAMYAEIQLYYKLY